ncbi:MAG: MFS transporter, partial [Oscillospiraceae bacterium]|nr:MFS transporter [Oscillospiraceae bacterium]
MNANNNGTKNKNVLFLGLVSFFTDLSTKMVYPLVPLYLTAVFGVTPALIGLIEGVVESLADILKVFSGRISDRLQKKKALAFAGYSTGVLYKILLVAAGSWTGVLFAKIVDRFGKGIRTAPRDMLISESAGEKSLGKSFGLQKMLDKAGSALGILIVYFLFIGGIEDFRRIFLISAIPAIVGLSMFFFVKERKTPSPLQATNRLPFFASLKKLDKRLKLYLFVVLLFTLGNSSNVFLLLRAQSVGFDDSSVILLFFAFTVSASVLALPLGKLSDKIGRKALLVSGYLVFSAAYLGFAFA